MESNSRKIPFSHHDSIHLFSLSPRLQSSLHTRKLSQTLPYPISHQHLHPNVTQSQEFRSADFQLESDLRSKLSKYVNVIEAIRRLASSESRKQYESNLNDMTDMTNSEATKQPILPNTSTRVADQNDEPSKDSVIDFGRKTDDESVPISSDRARAESAHKCKTSFTLASFP